MITRIAGTAALVLALALAGCGSDEPHDAGSTPSVTASADASGSPSAESTEAAAGVTVDVTIADGKVTPRGERIEVTVGERVTLRVTTDAADEIHVHSDPEHELEVAAGDRGKELSFALDTPGQVAVESHHLDATIVQLVVRP